MQLIVILLIIFLWLLWNRVKALKNDYEERLENLEFNAQLLKDKIETLNRQLAAKSDKSNKKQTVDGKQPAESEAKKAAESRPDSPAGAVKAETVKTPEKSAVKAAEPGHEPHEDKPGAAAAESDEFSTLSFTDKPEKQTKANNAAVSEETYEWLKQAKTDEQSSDKQSGADEGSAPPLPPVSPPDGPDWSERWQKFIAEVDWEQFTGTKLFAWLGGIALFVGAGFFVKYSIDNNLISPMLRLVIGAILGIAMIVGSFFFEPKRYVVMRQTFSAGGIGVLYSVFFAATLYYEYLPKTAGFASLMVVSAAAFVLAIFHKGVSISVLGALGAYLTPVLVNTGQGNILTLLAYLVIVNIGVYQVVKRLESPGLLLFSTVGTMASLALASVFSRPESDAMRIALAWAGHLALYAVFFDLLKKQFENSRVASYAVNLSFLAIPLVAFALAFFKVGASPMLLLAASTTLAVVLGFRISYLQQRVIPFIALTFFVTAFWTIFRFSPNINNWAFLLFFVYGLSGGVGPILLIHRHGINPVYLRWFRIFPVAIALLGLMAILLNPAMSFLFWPMTVGLQIVGIALSLIFGAILQVGFIAFLLVISALFFISSSTALVFNFTFYAFILFAGVAICLVTFLVLRHIGDFTQKLKLDAETTETIRLRPGLTEWMAASPVMGIFFVLAAAFLKASPLNPHPGMVTSLCFLGIAITLTRKLGYQYLGIVSLFSAAFAQAFWVFRPGLTTQLNFAAVIWSLFFFVAAIVVPFFFFKSYKSWKKLWMSWAIFEVVQMIFFVYAADHLWARDYSGWLPLVFALIKIPLLALMLKQLGKTPERNSIIACHGGVTLFYVSALPVLLLETGWLGLVLVVESAALLWLNRRVEHSGLRWVSAVMAPVGLYLLLSYLPGMKGPESIIILNPAVLSVLTAVIALAGAVKLSGYPDERLGRFSLVKYFQWLAFATGFYFINLVVADVFAGSKVANASTLRFLSHGNLLQQIAYATLWALFGAVLWRREKLPRPLRFIGVLLVCASTFWLIMFPFLHGPVVALMAPVFNLGLLAYLPIMAVLLYLFLKEPWGTRYLTVKNFFLALLLVVGLLCIKLVKSTIFQAGMPFELFRERTAEMAVASIAGWLIYGLAMLLWPKRLDKPFRIAGLLLILLSFARSLLFPFKHAAEFGAMQPLLNRPGALYLFIVAVLIWLVKKAASPTWPLNSIKEKSFWAVGLTVMSFLLMNIEIASVFGEKGQAFSLLTRGSLAHQLGYSLGWLIFAIIMLVAGIKWQQVRARQTALVLIIVTSLKIFLKDLWSLGQLYRVASFIGLAFVMMLVSYLYQRFLAKMGDK